MPLTNSFRSLVAAAGMALVGSTPALAEKTVNLDSVPPITKMTTYVESNRPQQDSGGSTLDECVASARDDFSMRTNIRSVVCIAFRECMRITVVPTEDRHNPGRIILNAIIERNPPPQALPGKPPFQCQPPTYHQTQPYRLTPGN